MPVELASGLGAVALFAVPGYALTELVPPLRQLPPPRRAAYGYLLGVSAVAGSLYALSHFFDVPLRPPAIWTVAAAPCLAGLAAAVVRRRRRRGGERAASVRGSGLAGRPGAAEGRGGVQGHEAGEGFGLAEGSAPASVERLEVAKGPGASAAARRPWALRIEIVCAVLAALVCAGLMAEAVSNPIHDWDGRMTWSAQARYVRADGSVDAGVLANERIYISHPQYPLLLPVAQVAALEAFHGGLDSHFQRALYAAFFPAFLLVIYDAARRAAGRTPAALVALAAAAVPFFTYGEGGAFSTYSDLPLACFYGAAACLLLWPRPSTAGGLAAGLLLAAAALCKNEGALLAAAALALGWRGAAGRRSALTRIAAAALPLLAALALLVAWRAGIPNRQDENYPDVIKTRNLWPGVVTHVTLFGPVLLRQMFRFHHWAGFWLLPPILFTAGRRALRHPRVRRCLLLAAAPAAIAWAAYSVHPQPAFLASVTWERFLLQGAIPLFIALAVALAQCWRQLRPAQPGGA
jgi:hypothetical protein